MPLMDFFEPPERRIRIEDQWKDLDLDTEYLRDPTKRHVMQVSERDCVRHGVVQNMRDLCAHICIPLDKCRRFTFGAPWRCKELQIAYTRCLNNDSYRVRAMVSRRFYELYGIDDGHDHKKNFLDQYRSPHNPLDPENHHQNHFVRYPKGDTDHGHH
eukprot:48654_1